MIVIGARPRCKKRPADYCGNVISPYAPEQWCNEGRRKKMPRKGVPHGVKPRRIPDAETRVTHGPWFEPDHKHGD